MRARNWKSLALLVFASVAISMAGCKAKANCTDQWGCYEPCDLLNAPAAGGCNSCN